MTTARRRLTDINFDFEGAHVALVGKHQGGPANGVTTLITKSTNHINPEQIALATAGQSEEQPQLTIEEPTVETIEKSVHETLVAKAVEDAVAAAVAIEKSAFAAQEEVLKAVQAELETLKVEKQAAIAKAREAALTEVVAADRVEGLLKAFAALDDEAFAVAVEGFKVQKAAEAQSELFNESGVAGTGAESAAEVDRTAEILKAKYAKK